MSSPTADATDRFNAAVPPGLTPEGIQRRQRLYAEWRRHSALIHIARRLFPALAMVLLAFLAVWAIAGTLVARLSATHQNGDLTIRLLKPNFQGRDENGKPYLLSADSAVRDDADAARVTLAAPVFTLGDAQQDQTHLRALRGVYHENTRVLDLRGQVHLDDSSGMHFVTEHALVDLQKNNVDGDQPIAGYGPLGRISASSYAVRGGGEHVLFTGRVKTHIERHGATNGVKPAAAAR